MALFMFFPTFSELWQFMQKKGKSASKKSKIPLQLRQLNLENQPNDELTVNRQTELKKLEK